MVLSRVCEWAVEERRHVYLEADGHPKLLEYYRQQGFAEGKAIRFRGKTTVYMERKPAVVSGRHPA
jgi:hypothetical protein